MFFWFFQDIMNQFFDILDDILSLIAPTIEIDNKPKPPRLGR